MLATMAALACLGTATHAGAQGSGPYPNKPVQLLVASAPGGGTDAIGRVLADALTASLKQPFVVVNRAGASGSHRLRNAGALSGRRLHAAGACRTATR
jgi:tripartite-type tricarboxylate transporter receptor subunit TctC